MMPLSSINKLAVIGHPIKHSLSPLIHQHFAKQHARMIDYQKIDCQNEQDFMALIEQSVDEYVGFNVTVPYKQCLVNYAKKHPNSCSLSSIAQSAQAANTIAYHSSKPHTISNTDGQGFLNHLKHLQVETKNKNILLIGAGGASMGLLAQLTSINTSPTIYLCNRTEQKAQDLCKKFNIIHWKRVSHDIQFDLIVNATAQGLDGIVYQNTFFNRENITNHTYFYDLFYQQIHLTPFLQYTAQHYPNHPHTDGLGMLIEQAALSYELWFGDIPNTAGLENRLRQKG